MTESGQMRALRMLAKHGEAVISSATSEPGDMKAGRKNKDVATVASGALVFIRDYYDDGIDVSTGRRLAVLNGSGRALCEALGIEVHEGAGR